VSTQEQLAHPAPTPDLDSAFYWDALREHRVLVQRCGSCATFRFPPMPACPYCASPETEVVEVGGEATVYSWIVVQRAFQEHFADDVPYTVATVDLLEGPRLVGWLEDADPVQAGLAVVPRFVDHESWTELRFVPKED
jgi:uncharacterized OB-fold protein